MPRSFALILLGFVALGGEALPVAAQSDGQECARSYVVRRGDTLSLIAGRLLGDPRAYQSIYIANAGVIGPDPAMIEVGMELRVPCPARQLAPEPGTSG